MDCKTCNTSLAHSSNYCPRCGAKVVRERLTLKNIGADFSEQFLNLDNTFLRTLTDLSLRPGRVVNDYISGVRKKYLGPVSYLGFSLACSGILFFILTKYYMDRVHIGVFDTNLSREATQNILRAAADYSSFLFTLLIPVMAIATRVSFNRKRYHIPEHIVASMYTLAHYNIASFPLSLAILMLTPETYFSYSLFFLVLMFAYALYVINAMNSLNPVERIWRSLVFMIIFLLGYLMISVLLELILLMTGVLNIQDLAPGPKSA